MTDPRMLADRDERSSQRLRNHQLPELRVSAMGRVPFIRVAGLP
jgi:hypothetical protein